MSLNPNTAYVRPDRVGLLTGFQVSELLHPEKKVGQYGLVLGSSVPVADIATGTLSNLRMARPGSSVIWTDDEQKPEILQVGRRHIIRSVDVVRVGRQKFFVRRQDIGDGSCVVEVETGIFGEFDASLLANNVLRPHGSFALDDGALIIGAQSTLGSELIRGAATRLRWRVEKEIPSTLIPFHRFDVWHLKPGGQIIVQGIFGKCFRIVCEKNNQLCRVDMPHGHAVFEDLESKRLLRNKENAERRKANSEVKSDDEISVELPAVTIESPAPVLTIPKAQEPATLPEAKPSSGWGDWFKLGR